MMNKKTNAQLTLETLLENLRAVRLNIESMPIQLAIEYLNGLIDEYEKQLKATDENGDLLK